MSKGYSDVLIGLQYGDEGKAKVIDLFAEKYDIIARFNGGANAGHTIVKDGIRLALHQIPSGIFYPEKILYIGSGCVINVEKLKSEIEEVELTGLKLDGRFHISDQAPVIQPHHIIIDKMTGKTIGTTGNGIGPCYADKALRTEEERLLNIRIGDILEAPEHFFERIRTNLKVTAERYNFDCDFDSLMTDFINGFNGIKSYIQCDTLFLDKKIRNGARVLFEGAQSFMLDITKGTVPFVTSSSTLAGAAYSGGDLNPKYHRKTIGVVKVIMSRVGFGPFISEFGGAKSEAYCMEEGGLAHTKDKEKSVDTGKFLASEDLFDVGIAMRVLGNEYGASTGRSRRTGMLDLVQLSYAARVNGIDELFLTKCDMLNLYGRTKSKKMPFIEKYELDGKEIDYVPGSTLTYSKVIGKMSEIESFSESIQELKSFDKLPASLLKFIDIIEKSADCKVMGIGTGPERESYILK